MKVKNLIKELEKCPKNFDVRVHEKSNVYDISLIYVKIPKEKMELKEKIVYIEGE